MEDGLLLNGRFGPTDPNAELDCLYDPEILARTFMDNARYFTNLGHYENRLYRTMTNALKQLKDLQNAREKFATDLDREARARFTAAWYTNGMPDPVKKPEPQPPAP